jgi:hypothetical protein
MPRISKATREDAIVACFVLADMHDHFCETFDVADTNDAETLADAAWCALYALRPSLADDDADGAIAIWLEAAALLRGDDEHEPWSPGHETYLLAEVR